MKPSINKMAYPILDNLKNFNLDFNCPECGNVVRALVEAGPVFKGVISDHFAYLICRCPRQFCAVLFVKYDTLNNRVLKVYPYPNNSASTFDNSIPEKIREDLSEAGRCYSAEAYKGVVVMCRRIMQQIALLNNIKGKDLKSQIDKMLKKGIITKSLHDAAHEIRFFGNFGAHPQKDNLDNVTYDDAKSVYSLINSFLIDLYIRPSEVTKLSIKRQTKSEKVL